MLEKKSYWWIIAGTCIGGAFVVQACTVTTSSDASGGAGGSAGTAGSGISGTAGATAGASGSSAGSSGSSGSSGTAGAAGSAGTGPAAYECDPDSTTEPTPIASCDPTMGVPGAMNDACMKCVINNAATCADFKACFGAYANGNGDQCGYGGQVLIQGVPEGEFYCYVDCMKTTAADAGVGDAVMCSNMCQTLMDSKGPCMMAGGGLGIRTNNLIADIAATNCSTDCGITPG